MLNRVRDKFRDSRLPQVACAVTTIQIRFNLFGGRSLVLRQLKGKRFTFRNLFPHRFWSSVVQPECHEIRSTIGFPMWKRSMTAITNLDITSAGARRPTDSRRDAGATFAFVVH
ncbi:MAG TPA: hypothetical protein VG897_06070 [Terriglobales bacterium]|nr:hypothetical protein [Terriglobales bacterium]